MSTTQSEKNCGSSDHRTRSEVGVKVIAPFKCPVCSGTGRVSWPPGVPGDVPYFSASTACNGWTCQACHGTCIVWREEWI